MSPTCSPALSAPPVLTSCVQTRNPVLLTSLSDFITSFPEFGVTEPVEVSPPEGSISKLSICSCMECVSAVKLGEGRRLGLDAGARAPPAGKRTGGDRAIAGPR